MYPNEILKYYKVNIINQPEDFSKFSPLHYIKTWCSSPKRCLRIPPFYIAMKMDKPRFGMAEGGDWLFQRDSNGRDNLGWHIWMQDNLMGQDIYSIKCWNR